MYDGRPLAGVEIRIDDGEVQLRGPMLFEGYEGEPERTADAMKDGWFQTNDLGRLDDGRLSVTGRADDVIISGGLKIPGTAVERMLARHPSILEVAVVGVPDEEWGERVVAFCVANGDPRRDIEDAVVPHDWSPKQWVRVEEMPLLPNGKVDRMKLKAMA